eukprot:TRINITY_DN3965_c0_g1_i12.p1 TRINITY_DN3965_c0_g1~~TRINITY_DN3965_c0_g1_i12.p1  ORF type:complete len:526 (-),score=11.13 TRINITY_DN3965_c0_g1_i12:241-1818(-)
MLTFLKTHSPPIHHLKLLVVSEDIDSFSCQQSEVLRVVGLQQMNYSYCKGTKHIRQNQTQGIKFRDNFQIQNSLLQLPFKSYLGIQSLKFNSILYVQFLYNMSNSSIVTQQRGVPLIIGNQNYQYLLKLQVTLNDGLAVNEFLKKLAFEIYIFLDQTKKQMNIESNQIMQNKFQYLPKLRVTLNDRLAVKELFKKLGFETHIFFDQTKKQMNSVINEFSNEIMQNNDLVFFDLQQFFRDHVMHSVLCGIDATTDHDGVSLTIILNRYFQKKVVYLIILDACRTFPETMEECIIKGRGGSSTMQAVPQFTLGMPEIPRGKEVEILFACQPDTWAREEQQKNLGYIVRALQDALKKVDRWDDVNKYIIRQVKEETDNRQTPVVQTSISQPLYIRQVNAQPSQSDPTEPSKLNIPSSSAAISPLRPSQIDTTLQDAIQIFKAQGKLENARIKLTEGQFKKSQWISFKYVGLRKLNFLCKLYRQYAALNFATYDVQKKYVYGSLERPDNALNNLLNGVRNIYCYHLLSP